MKLLISVFITLLCISQSSLKAQDTEDFDRLMEWMTGEFDSAEQAKDDTSYYNITLKMSRIWPEMTNGAWIYVEQAVASSPAEPYRQRVYFVSEITDGQYSSDIYELEKPEDYVGAWKNISKFAGMKPFDLKYKDGCTVFLGYDGFQYSGKTNEGTCLSTMRGAEYATSEVVILGSELRSWDRGFDSEGNQVWGAEKGAYIFKKR